MDAIVRFLLPMRLGLKNSRLLRPASLTHTHTFTHTDTQMRTHTNIDAVRCRHMQTTPADVHTHCKYDIRIPGCFDLPAAVMTLVVKLLLSFNIVYRQWHLLAGTVIYPFLRYTVFPLNTISTRSTAAGHPCHIFDAPIHQPILEIWSFSYIQW